MMGAGISPERAAQVFPIYQQPVSPLQGFFLRRFNPGLRPLRALRPGLCYSALSALEFAPPTEFLDGPSNIAPHQNG
jgi:hypothetical protein